MQRSGRWNTLVVVQHSDQIKAHASRVVSVVGLVFAASVPTGVLSGTSMVETMARWLVEIVPEAFGLTSRW
ncbi:hypothetical protein ACWDKQ_31470 [Saccharopolyspora sp. NPDC000995]